MLPIVEIKEAFLQAITQHQTVVLTAPPGAGKSTVLPLWLLETDFAAQKIYLLQPRRVAAKNIACYLAKQLGENVGETVGYRLKNETKVSTSTKLEVITEGILTQIIQRDPELNQASLILFDEFHERSIHADVAFALARDCQLGLNEKLTLVLMSATLASDEIKASVDDAVFIESQGRSFPIELSYAPVPRQMLWRTHVLNVIRQSAIAHQGSCLVFLPGVADIKFIEQQLTTQTTNQLPDDLVLAPLYGELPLAKQQNAINPVTNQRKLVLATNVAETSLTIEGISLVIDAGLEKVAVYDSQTLTNQLVQKPISKASAIQRAGRAGRLNAGQCIRLYSQEDFERRPEQATRDIEQTDLLPVIIEAARWGVTELAQLPMIELPNSLKEQLAWQELQQLNVVDKKHKLTAHGLKVANMACHPRFGHMLIKAGELAEHLQTPELVSLACLISALIEERDILTNDMAKDNADIGVRIEMLIATACQNSVANRVKAKASRILLRAKQLAKLLGHQWHSQLLAKINRDDAGALLALAYPERIAKRRGQQTSYLALNGKGLELSPQDNLLDSELLVAANTVLIKGKQLISLAAPVTLSQLVDWQIVEVTTQQSLIYDEQKHAIVGSTQQLLGAIVLAEQPDTVGLTEALIANMWQQQVTKNGIEWLNFGEATQQLLARINWLAYYQPQLDFPALTSNELIAQLDQWFTPYVGTIKKKAALAQLDYSAMLLALLSYEQQQQLKQLAPAQFIAPTGRKCIIRYQDTHHPMVALPMQEMYGQAQTPQVGDTNQGCGVNITLELLSPAGRPIQVTQDLAGFWQGSYKDVQKEMKGRYPKHFWPDDPANAQATNKTKRHLANTEKS
ncbi:ATP-dependent helicase HrpB [Colwellia sp. MEBiC06753]